MTALTGELGAEALAIFKLPLILLEAGEIASTDSLLFKPTLLTATIFFPLAKLLPVDNATGVAVEPDDVGVIMTKVGPLEAVADLDGAAAVLAEATTSGN